MMDSQINYTINLESQELLNSFNPSVFDTAVERLAEVDTTPVEGPIYPYQDGYPEETEHSYNAGALDDSILFAHNESPVELLGIFAPRYGPPDQTPFRGQYNFTVDLCSSPSNNKCLMSTKLNKIYVDMGVDIPFQFNWSDSVERAWYVRACAVFVEAEHAEKRVHCCLQHRPPALESHVAQNVLHSARAAGTAGVHYGGGARPDAWLCVLVAFAPRRPRTHTYKFICKNSCSSGINRRAIGIVFTLEDGEGVVHGRQVINARVCSCPPRDRRKDEGEERAPKRRLAPHGKRVKLEPDAHAAQGLVLLEQIAVIDPQTAIAGYETMVRMTQHAAALSGDTQHSRTSLEALHAAIERLRRV